MKTIYHLAIGGLLIGLLFIGVVTAVPQVLPASSSLVDVDGVVDYFEFAPGGLQATGTVWTLTSPSGVTADYEKSLPTCTNRVRFYLGSLNPDTASNCEDGAWIGGTSLNGEEADGTWTIKLTSPGTYFSDDVSGTSSETPGVTLNVNGKSIRFGVGTNPSTQQQIWNWRTTCVGCTWTETSTINGISLTIIDPINEAPDEDPNNAVYFQDSPSTPFTAHTLHSTVTCASNTFEVNGAWQGASGTTFTRYVYLDGNFVGTNDLRTILGAQLTTEENEGAASSGTDIDSGLPYNNVAGVSYQFIARTASQGEVLGTVQWASSNQCTTPPFPTTANTEHNADALMVTVSQAQCKDDAVTFNVMMQDNPSGLQEHLLQLFVFDANQGGLNTPPDPVEVLYFDTTTMHRTALADEAHAHFIAEVLPPGNYIAYAYADYTGVGAIDYVASEAFNIPRGTCLDATANLDPVLLAIASHHANNTDYLDHINNHLHQLDSNLTFTRGQILDAIENLNLTIIGNVTGNFTIDNATLSAIYNLLTTHTERDLTMQEISALSVMALFILAVAVAEWKKDAIYHLLATLVGALSLGKFTDELGIPRLVILAIIVYQLWRMYKVISSGNDDITKTQS